MKLNDSFLIIAIVAALFILVIFIAFFGIFDFEGLLTGKATNEGYFNITIMTSININMTQDSINWSSGIVDSGETNATLYTRGNDTGIVQRGNWSGAGAKAFVVENIGGVNSSIRLLTVKNAHDFFNSSTNSNEQYMWNVSNKESNSCSGGAVLGMWAEVNKTAGGTEFCGQFDNSQTRNEIYIDILLTIPYDAQNFGEQSDTLTVTADAAG
ncbi:MAG: hypothetical protein ABH840_00750 [Nanoarchaeota archaeon]